MSYTPINWQTGDTITAEKMNKMDNGWSVDTSAGTLFNETVTTELEDPEDPAWGMLQYSSQITADTITVTFNGTDYQCQPFLSPGGNYYYGGWGEDGSDFTNFPFAIESGEEENWICTPTEGTYTVNVAASTTTIETTEGFRSAVGSFIDAPMQCIPEVTTYDEMNAARQNGQLMYFYVDGECHFVSSFVNDTSQTAVTAVPAGVANVATFGFGEDGDGNLIFNVFYY